jgi:PAS domain S-box-containing protein
MENGRDANGLRSLNRHTLEQIIAASAAGIVVADAQDPRLPIVYANQAYERLTGRSAAELVGRPWALVTEAEEGDAEVERVRMAIARGEPCRATVTDRCKDGSPLASEISLTPLHNARGELKYVLCLQHTVGASDEAKELPVGPSVSAEVTLGAEDHARPRPKTSVADRIDPATGLLKFSFFQATVSRDLSMARREGRFVTLLLFEIVDLDMYRRTFGDKAAESCQRMIGAQITRTLRRSSDLCARYDDSTLVAAVVGQEPTEAQQLADQIVADVRRLGLHNPRGKSGRYVTVRSIVIGCPPAAYDDPLPVILEALSGARRADPQLRVVQG